MKNDFIWEAAEQVLAIEKFYVENEYGRLADQPAFLVVAHPPRRYGLYLNGVGRISFFTSKAALHRRLKEIIEAANFPLRVWKGRRAKQPFAVNTERRIHVGGSGFVRAFNITEWEDHAIALAEEKEWNG